MQTGFVVLVVGGLLAGFALRGVEWYHAPAIVRVAKNVTAILANGTGNGTLMDLVDEDEGYDDL